MKKILFTLMLLVAATATMSAYDFELDGICYWIEDNEAVVTKNEARLYSGHVTIPASVTYNGITYSVTSIGYEAFSDCTGLTSIDIPNSVRYIGGWAFSGCTGLTSIVIPSSVEFIDIEAFFWCSGLKSIKVDSGNPNYDSRDNCNAIIETAWSRLMWGCQNTTIPNSVTTIGEGAFYGCSGLTSIDIPNSVNYIEWNAFAYSGLISIVIPSSVEFIDKGAFYGCSLETVKCLGTEPPYISKAERTCCFSEQIHRNATLIVPRNCEEAYLTDNCWCMFDHIESWGSAGPGDVDSDGRLNISDVTALIDILLSGETSNMEADVDGDGLVNITDVTVLIDKLLNNEQPNVPYGTPAPELTVVTDADAEVVILTATGEGSIIIYEVYSNDYYDYAQAVATGDGEATFVIPFGDWVTSVHVRATAQADDDALVGIGDLEYVRILAKQVDPGSDDDSHNTGYWLVMVQDSGAKDYVQLQQGANGDYVWFYDVVYPPYFNIGNFYFLINGVPYGAPVDGTEAYVGDAMMNPLFANSSNTYYVYSGYSYTIGIHIVLDEAGEVAGYTVYAAQAGPV